MTQRLDWIDFAKGIAICLVVLGHAGIGITTAEISDPHNLLGLIDKTIYAFHMPFFFMLSGITFGMWPPAGIHPALTKRVWRLFYVMSLWTYAFLILRAMSGGHANSGGSWTDILVLPLPPFAHFWFLWALLLNIVVFTLLRLACARFVTDRLFWTMAFPAAVILNVIVVVPAPLAPYFAEALAYSLPFVVGAFIATTPLLGSTPEWPKSTASILMFMLLLSASVLYGLPLPDVSAGVLISLFLLAPLIAVSTRFGHLTATRAIVYLGVMSLPIYVMHTMFSAVLRIVLVKAGSDHLALHLISGTAIGLLGPLAVYHVAKRTGHLKILGLA